MMGVRTSRNSGITMNLTERMIGSLNCTVVDTPGVEKSLRAIALICHGFGASGQDLVPLAPEIYRSDPAGIEGIRFIFPMAPIILEDFGGYDSRAWWPIDMLLLQELMASGDVRELRHDRPPLLEKRYREMAELLEGVRSESGLSNDRIVVGGFSQGAMLATEVALRTRPQLGGLIIWSGTLLDEDAWRKWAAETSGLPVVQTHGRLDPILPYTGGQELHEMLLEAGQSVRFSGFDGPHTIPPDGIRLAAGLLATVAASRS
jgi:phospholipase/carboxylesterase